MATITPNVAPGSYLDHQTVGFTFDPDVSRVAASIGDIPPSISKYVAYDTITPPNPFIAVTEDGLGRVVYDGGFPKFYNFFAPPLGINDSVTMEFSATCTGGFPGSNLYYYNAFSDQHVTIADGDKLVYDIFQNSLDSRAAIDAITSVPDTTPYVYSLRDWGGLWMDGVKGIVDQNGHPAHPAANLEGKSFNQWYHREFDLSPCAGHTFIRWSMAYEGEVAGEFYTRFRDVYVIDKNGEVKATIFKNKIDLPENTSTESHSSGYTNLVKTIYDPRGQLNASLKYLYNAINWVINRAKLSTGNRRILIISDGTADKYYSIKDAISNDGFKKTFDGLTSVMGLQPTYVDLSDYGGNALNPTLGFLEQFVCAIFVGVGWGSQGQTITTNAINDFVTYRENGNGIIMITDHGMDHANITSAASINQTGFFRAVNLLATRFGAYFTGNYDRVPVNVGFLRNTYGDHPLYDGMTNAEFIEASGSESRVVVSSDTTYTPAQLPKITTKINGINKINVLALHADGSVTTARFVYIVAGDEILFITSINPSTGVGEVNKGIIYADEFGLPSFTVRIDGSALGTVWGEILRNGKRMGELDYAAGIDRAPSYLPTHNDIRLRNGDVIEYKIQSPFTYSKQFVVRRKEVSAAVINSGRWGRTVMAYTDKLGLDPQGNAYESLKAIVSTANKLPQKPVSTARIRSLINDVIETRLGNGPFSVFIYDTDALAAQAAQTIPILPGRYFISAQSGKIYAYLAGTYKLIADLYAIDIFPAPCVLTYNSKRWALSISGEFTLLQ